MMMIFVVLWNAFTQTTGDVTVVWSRGLPMAPPVETKRLNIADYNIA